ncbi:MAG: NADH-quinone oxidoreductase subunit C [Hyphomicrobiales bacterium]
MDESLREIGAHISSKLGDSVMTRADRFGELTLTVEAEQIVKILRFLRDDAHCRFVVLVDIAGVDYPGRRQRFEVVYHLLSPFRNARIRIKLDAGEDAPVMSVGDIFPAALWYEREIYDLYGVTFSGHHDLRRILTDYGFEGFPLRKDFPLTGYVELRYDNELRRVVYEPVKLQQQFRDFDYLSPWEGPRYMVLSDEEAEDRHN